MQHVSTTDSASSVRASGGLRPILVTGAPRSGTTWVGRIIGASPSTGYVQEPFNLVCRPGRCAAHFQYWFTYICEENEEQYIRPIEQTLQFRYQILEELKATRTPWDVARMARDFSQFQSHRIRRCRPLLRDPQAFFSAEWLAQRFSADVLVLIRHPAAFVGSFKSLRWEHPFDHFLKQSLLMRDYLHPFEDEIRKFAEQRQDVVDQAILLWRLIHSVILRYRETHPEWTFARHRDLSSNPLAQFRTIFERLGLPYGPREEINTRHFCMAEASPDGYIWNSVVRNSAQNMDLWRTRLTEEEMGRVREKCSDLARQFYTEDELQNIGLAAKA
ncbi:MAG TPA: sulfotransferase [Verrucomicrobiae bacterium]|nr:sulfotransferase [Verrucomicrobiae bacterium]